jgi:hypothetical protein
VFGRVIIDRRSRILRSVCRGIRQLAIAVIGMIARFAMHRRFTGIASDPPHFLDPSFRASSYLRDSILIQPCFRIFREMTGRCV